MGAPAVRWTTARVAARTEVVPGVLALDLAYPEPVPEVAGSHVDLVVQVGGTGPGGAPVRSEVRSYSLVSADPAARSVRIAVRLAAEGAGGSRYVHGLAVDDRLRVTHPQQDFPLTHGRPGYVLVAGGIGITPLVAMVRSLRARDAPVRLVYAGRSRTAMPFLVDLERDHGDVLDVLAGDEGRRLDPVALVAGVPEGHELYVCGPIRLLDGLRAAWRDAGRPANRFRFETFGNSGRHAPAEFEVEVPALGLTTTVGVGTSLLDALDAAGADVMFDCRRGECGLCEVRVLAVDGEIDHRDVFFDDAQHARGDRMCTCVSRVVARTAEPGDRAPAGRARLVLELP